MKNNTKSRTSSFRTVPQYMHIEDICALLGISESAAYKLVNTPGFPRLKINTLIIVDKDAFHTWLAKQTGEVQV